MGLFSTKHNFKLPIRKTIKLSIQCTAILMMRNSHEYKAPGNQRISKSYNLNNTMIRHKLRNTLVHKMYIK